MSDLLWAAVVALPHTVLSADFDSIILAVVTMAIVFMTPAKISRKVPSPLLALIAGTPPFSFYTCRCCNYWQDTDWSAISGCTNVFDYGCAENFDHGYGVSSTWAPLIRF